MVAGPDPGWGGGIREGCLQEVASKLRQLRSCPDGEEKAAREHPAPVGRAGPVLEANVARAQSSGGVLSWGGWKPMWPECRAVEVCAGRGVCTLFSGPWASPQARLSAADVTLPPEAAGAGVCIQGCVAQEGHGRPGSKQIRKGNPASGRDSLQTPRRAGRRRAPAEMPGVWRPCRPVCSPES